MRSVFYTVNGVSCKELLRQEDVAFLIDEEGKRAPFSVSTDSLMGLEQNVVCAADVGEERSEKCQATQQKRLNAIKRLLADERCISDGAYRSALAKDCAADNGYQARTLMGLYYRVLAQGEDALFSRKREKADSLGAQEKDIKWAVNKFYFSQRKCSLRQAYALLLLNRYTEQDGKLLPHPSYSRFYYYYRTNMRNSVKKVISREGITRYQQRYRPLYGSASQGVDYIGVYQMDATDADIHLVSKYNRGQPIGRPKIYLAVDTASRLIAGLYVGLEGGENAVLDCLKQAAGDKVAYCARYGVTITEEQWPSKGIPGRIYTDKGPEFMGKRVDELCRQYGIVREAAQSHRPDQKGVVENCFHVLQENYKHLLRHKGVIEENYAERGVPSYVREATLNLDEFTKVVICCVLKINNTQVIRSIERTPKMAEADVAPRACALWHWYAQQGQSSVIPVTEEEIRYTLLPIGSGKLTRSGLLFNGLTYCRDKYSTKFANAGIDGQKRAKVAYDILSTDTIYLIEDKKYIPFHLTSAKERYAESSFADVLLFRKEESADKRRYQEDALQGELDCARRIQTVGEAAAKEKEALIGTADVRRLTEYRQRDKEDRVF